MTPTGYAARARKFLEGAREKSEISEISPTARLSNDPVPFAPLDSAIAASEAGRRSLAEIESRLARVTARATDPAATALDRQVARDWTAIHRVKLSGERAA